MAAAQGAILASGRNRLRQGGVTMPMQYRDAARLPQWSALSE
jgi:hypothetical protein